MKAFRIVVPASCGNVGPGFDVLGAALGLYNELVVERTGGRGLDLGVEGEGARELSMGANLVLAALRRFGGLKLRMINRIPLARGLGSSGTARLAARAAARALEGRPIEPAVEEAARDEGHADNVAASFFGGLVASRWDGRRLISHRWPVLPQWSAVVAIPEFKLATKKARAVLPRRVPMGDAVENIGKSISVVAALALGGTDALASALDDALHQPYRRRLVPGFEKVRAAAKTAGASGACLSGAGPSMLAVVPRAADPEKVGRAMASAFKKAGVASRAVSLEFDNRGTRVEGL